MRLAKTPCFQFLVLEIDSGLASHWLNPDDSDSDSHGHLQFSLRGITKHRTTTYVLCFCLILWLSTREDSVTSASHTLGTREGNPPFQLLKPSRLARTRSSQLLVSMGLAWTQLFQLLVPLELAWAQPFQPLLPLGLCTPKRLGLVSQWLSPDDSGRGSDNFSRSILVLKLVLRDLVLGLPF